MQDALQFYINGQWVDPIAGQPFDVIDPSTEEAVARISLGGQADAEAAIAAAKTAFETWGESTKQERLDLLHETLTVYQRRNDEMGEAISREMGAPIDMAKGAQAGTG
ncbi:MAG: aldehyde dehydrogenase family protein, partial [Pseudomonadota bacterium]